MSHDLARIARSVRCYDDLQRSKEPLLPTPGEPKEIAGAGIDEANAIRHALQALPIPERGPIIGYKIALTAPMIQQ